MSSSVSINSNNQQSTSANVSVASTTSKPTDLFEDWKSTKLSGMVSTKDAKRDYFLTTDDLAGLPCYKFGGGIGCGPPMKCYKHDDLVAESLSLHGRAGVTKKLEARQKREMNKRRKEEKAEEARKKLKSLTNTADGAAAAGCSNPVVKAVGDTKEIKKLRGSLLKMAKKKMGFEMSGAPSRWRIEVPGTSKATFSALMGRPADVNLDSFVKNGAYHTVEGYDVEALFGTRDESQLTKDFKREGVTQKIGSYVTVRYKESAMELSVSGWGEIW